MKQFTKLESGKYITEGIDAINEFHSMQNKLEKDLGRVAELAKKADEFTLPQVDILSRVTLEEKIDQYIFADDVRSTTAFHTVENATRKTYKEIEVKRVENDLVYTLMQDEFKAVGIADLDIFSYKDAVEIAKSRAIVDLEYQKQKKIYGLIDGVKSFVVIKGGIE